MAASPECCLGTSFKEHSSTPDQGGVWLMKNEVNFTSGMAKKSGLIPADFSHLEMARKQMREGGADMLPPPIKPRHPKLKLPAISSFLCD